MIPEGLKQSCSEACHERHACSQGYKELLQAKTAYDMAVVWKRYWNEFVSDKYADIICRDLPRYYDEVRDELNRAGVYLNECPTEQMNNALVIVGNADAPVHIYGMAKAYVIGKARAVAHHHARVFSTQPDSIIELHDYTFGDVRAGYAIARHHATLTSHTYSECYDAASVVISSATLHDHGHFMIDAYGEAIVSTFTDRRITLHDNAQIKLEA